MFNDDCIYCQEIPTTDLAMPQRNCLKHASTDERYSVRCVGIARCADYTPGPMNGESTATTDEGHEPKDFKDHKKADLPPCVHRATYNPDMCGNLNMAVGKCRGEATCPNYIRSFVAENSESQYDAVSKPSHYTEGRKYEPKDVIRDWGLNFNLGNTVKYVARAGRKDDILQDLRKARQYLDFEIEYLEKEREEP